MRIHQQKPQARTCENVKRLADFVRGYPKKRKTQRFAAHGVSVVLQKFCRHFSEDLQNICRRFAKRETPPKNVHETGPPDFPQCFAFSRKFM